MGIQKVELDQLLTSSDIVSLHVPKTSDTSNIISADALNKMKKGAMLINCARGGLVDELALRAALESGHLRGAAAIQVAEQMAEFLVNGAVKNALNAPNLTAEEARKLKPYLQLSQRLGSFVGQLTNDPIRSITVTYGGEAAKVNTDPLTTRAQYQCDQRA